MQWAARRRLIVGSIIGGVVFVVLALLVTAALYRSPSCVDKKQNQDEEGVDCGGSCQYLCRAGAEAPVTPIPRLLRNSAGRTDLVASIENRNFDAAAKEVSFSVKLYDANLTFVREIEGVLDLPPRTLVPIFIPGVATKGESGMRATLEIATSTLHWYRVSDDPRIVPFVTQTKLGGAPAAPRVEATLTNPSIATITRIPVVALIRDNTTGNIIAASQTVVSIAPQGDASAIFTWNEAFAAPSVRIDVIPMVPMP